MSHAVKTVGFVATALVMALIATFTYPRQEDYQAPDLVGKDLFAEFTDPGTAADLTIVKFAEDVGELTEFQVSRDPNTELWSIPSSANYPADAETQMRDAATSLIDLQVLGLATEEARNHEVYGVVEPDKQKLDASQEGVGLMVGVRDAKGKELARLIIGKPVRGTDDQHFVRRPGQNQVYVVRIDPAKFPTEFEKWIERDLLKINTFDVERVVFRDYSIVTTQTLSGPRGRLDERFEAQVRWDSDTSKWVLDEMAQFRDGQRTPTSLLPTEELNTQKLNDMKSALGSMQIVGVLRKPTGLGANLQAGTEFLNSEEAVTSLMNRGFYPVRVNDGEPEIRAANGEVLVGQKDGVEYVLRFGEIASVEQDSEDGKVSRYLFVTTRLDESRFPPLELEPLPGGDDGETPETPQEGDADQEAGDQEGTAQDDTAEKSELELARERIRKENQRKQDEREEALKKANQRIRELNSRFADWFYIISEDEYRKIRLGRNDLIRESETAAEEGFGVDALRQLEREGIEEDEDDDVPAPPPSSFMPPMGPG
jgi:hypothetical protein